LPIGEIPPHGLNVFESFANEKLCRTDTVLWRSTTSTVGYYLFIARKLDITNFHLLPGDRDSPRYVTLIESLFAAHINDNQIGSGL